MNWDATDFIVAGALIAGVGLTFWLVTRSAGSNAYRWATGVALVAGLMLVWVNLAVGIIGAEGNRANLMFYGVLAVGVVGALIARFEARGMMHALQAMAGAQMLVAGIAIALGMGTDGPAWPRDLLFITVFFTALWLIAAWLFGGAAAAQVEAE